MTRKAVILAAGLGTRMRRSASESGVSGSVEPLSDQQASVAAQGMKALIPIDRPFLDYSLSRLADAGFRSVCLVIGPQHDQVRSYYRSLDCRRISIEFAVQPQPLGTADALAWAADFAGDDPVLVLNGDNYYPADALSAARQATGPTTIGFHQDSLIANSNIPADRVAAYAVMEQDDDGYLRRIIEKPDPEMLNPPSQPLGNHSAAPYLISMNCWRFEPAIFQACRSIEKSSRGEYEMADAVMHSIDHLEQRYRVTASHGGVLDLSHQEDIASVTHWLHGVEVQL